MTAENGLNDDGEWLKSRWRMTQTKRVRMSKPKTAWLQSGCKVILNY